MFLLLSEPPVSAPANHLTPCHYRQRKVTIMMEKYAWSKFNKMEVTMMMMQVMCAKRKLLKVKDQTKGIWRLNTCNPSCNVLIPGSARSNISYSG